MKIWKKVLSMAVCFALIVTLLPVVACASGGTVRVRVEGYETTIVSQTSVEVIEGENLIDILVRLFNKNGATYTLLDDGTYLSKVNEFGYVEDETAGSRGWMYKVNGTAPWDGMSDYYPTAGDDIEVYYQYDYNSQVYGNLNSTAKTAYTNETVSFTLEANKEEWFWVGPGEWDYDFTITSISSECTIRIDGVNTNVSPDSGGEFELSFNKVGTHKVSAFRDSDNDGLNDLTHNYCFVTVKSRPSGGGLSGGGSVVTQPPSTEAPEETPAPSAPAVPVYRQGQFNDIQNNYWGAPAVEFAITRGLFNGVSDNEFAPDENMTRAMVATVLQRATFSETIETIVVGGNWYDEAMQWAVENELLVGTDNGLEPETSVTREQLVTILWRYSGKPGVPSDSDVQGTSEWAVPAMQWAIQQGIIDGDDNGQLNPQKNATRIEVAIIMQRYIENFLETPDISAIVTDTAEYLMKKNPNPSVGAVGGDWVVYGLAKNGKLSEEYKTIYLKNMGEYVTTSNGILSANKYTEYARVVLALSACGIDSKNIEGHDLASHLLDYEKVAKQGINGEIYALIALGDNEQHRNSILSKQLENGMFTLGGDKGELDITAMAIQALGKCEASDKAANALEKANFTSTESYAQAIIAFGGSGRDIPQAWIDGLLARYEKGKGFNNNEMTTEQAFIALMYLN